MKCVECNGSGDGPAYRHGIRVGIVEGGCGACGGTGEHRERYRNCTIRYDPPPIPLRNNDWAWVHDEYDGFPDRRCGTEASPEACRARIDEMYEEQA